MSDELNPYAAPPASEGKASSITPLESLRGPSTGLLVVSALSIAGGVVSVTFLVLLMGLLLVDLQTGDSQASEAVNRIGVRDMIQLGLMVVSALSSLFIAYGAICMRTGLKYRTAVFGAALACLPVPPCLWLGIPLGIWALIVLRRPAVRAAFQP